MLPASQVNLNRQQLNGQSSQLPQYKPTNAYSHKPAIEQILTIFAFLLIVTMHAVFITVASAISESPILWVLVSMTYGLLVVIVYDYFYITCTDPADDLLITPSQRFQDSNLIYCKFCKVKVRNKSHHCSTCKRCVDEFDHHCKYLNNCIGGKNYTEFIRLLMTITFFCASIIFQGIWVFVVAHIDQNYRQSIVSRWGTLATLILAFIMLVAVDSLLFFHCYLIFQLKMTTLQYIRRSWELQETQQERPKGQKRQIS